MKTTTKAKETLPMIHTFQDLCTYTYVLVDDLYQTLIAPYDHRPGPDSVFSDSEVITLTLVAELIGMDKEKPLLSYVRRNHLTLFPHLPERTRFNRRRRSLGEATNTIRRRIKTLLLSYLDPEDYQLVVLDSLPIPVVGFAHAPDEHRWHGHAAFGRITSKHCTIYGFKLHLLITSNGLILDFVLAAANQHDSLFTETLLGDQVDLVALGDKAYPDRELQAQLRESNEVILLTHKRANQKVQHPPSLNHAIAHYRQMVETVVSQLASQFHIETNHAKSMSGLIARLHSKLAAHTLGLYLNVLAGRPMRSLADLALI